MERRGFLIGSACALVATSARAHGFAGLRAPIAALEKEIGGRIGLALRDTGSGAHFAWRASERFPMCSTFKFLLAADILARVDAGTEALDRRVPIAAADLLSHAPFAETRVGGTASVAELAKAAIALSDNGAANLLLARVGGPAGLTRFVRTLGDPLTRLDRPEPTLNEATPGDPRDTTTPAAMLGLMDRLLLGRTLSPPSRRLLTDWMLATETGGPKLRASLPADWRIADKTGGGEHGSDNEIALLFPPGRAPLLVASYLTGSELEPAETNPIHARIGRLISAA